mmetsp:Transcript_11658/g.19365  ORF Transcript_11658/g.19365 Transcript_11658/m.19365 type:complete len:217 (+) Transcript_11658:1516-2166(+)
MLKIQMLQQFSIESLHRYQTRLPSIHAHSLDRLHCCSRNRLSSHSRLHNQMSFVSPILRHYPICHQLVVVVNATMRAPSKLFLFCRAGENLETIHKTHVLLQSSKGILRQGQKSNLFVEKDEIQIKSQKICVLIQPSQLLSPLQSAGIWFHLCKKTACVSDVLNTVKKQSTSNCNLRKMSDSSFCGEHHTGWSVVRFSRRRIRLRFDVMLFLGRIA